MRSSERLTPTVSAVLAAIESSPGISKSDLCRELGRGWGTISHHVARLSVEARIRIVRDGRQTHIFARHVEGSQARWLAALRDEASGAILGALRDAEPRSAKELSVQTGLSVRLMRRKLQHLGEVGLLARTDGPEERFQIDSVPGQPSRGDPFADAPLFVQRKP